MILCFDVGGTTIKPGRAYSPEAIEMRERIPTPTGDFAAFTAVLRAEIAACAEPPEAVALAIPGIVEPESGRAAVANVPCLTGRRVAEELAPALGLPVVLANDADCFALAEAQIGAGRGHRTVFGAILGTGVGGGLVIDGRLVNAGGGFAGEWGHGPVAARLAGDPEVQIPAFACGCGLAGCLDPTVSARGLERLHRHLQGEEATSHAILAAWEAGEPGAARTVAVHRAIVAPVMAMIVNMVGADVIVLGGGLSGNAALVAALDAAVRPFCLRRFARPLVVAAEIAEEPGIVGAAILGFARP